MDKSNVNIKEDKSKKSLFNNIIPEYCKFFKENLRKKTIVIFVITLIVFLYFLIMFFNNIDFNNAIKNGQNVVLENNGIFSMIKEKVLVVILLVVSGITPYIYIPVIGIFTSYGFSSSIVTLFGSTNTFNLIAMSIGAIIQILGISIAIAQGIYYCKLSTKKFKYSQTNSFGFDDLKKSIYEIRKNEEKVKKIAKKQEEKLKKQQALNVKVPYKMIFTSIVISIVIVVLGTLIARI